jgi:hypothetical protein
MAPVVSLDASRTVSSGHEATAVREGVVAASSVAVSGVAKDPRGAIKEGGLFQASGDRRAHVVNMYHSRSGGLDGGGPFSGRSLDTVRLRELEGAAIFRQALRPVGSPLKGCADQRFSGLLATVELCGIPLPRVPVPSRTTGPPTEPPEGLGSSRDGVEDEVSDHNE